MSWTKGRAWPPAGWKRTRAAVLERDGNRCTTCGSTLGLEVDHVHGNTDHQLANLRTLCGRCHTARTKQQASAARWADNKRAKRPTPLHPALRRTQNR